MKNRYAAYISVLIILAFILYIVYDSSSPDPEAETEKSPDSAAPSEDKWQISGILTSRYGKLNAVSVSSQGVIYTGGDSYTACYTKDLQPQWNLQTANPVTSLTTGGDTIFASTQETILLINSAGRVIDEWGPYDDGCIITSITSNRAFIAVADAGNKLVFILKKSGELRAIIGHSGKRFIIPSPYFDVALTTDNTLFVANTGERRIEARTLEGDVKGYFGEPGIAPERFCGCCNPAHFALISDGIVTSEKGINRIKIINKEGGLVEIVSGRNGFPASVPLDVAACGDNIVYAANPADSRLYIFTRK